MPFSTAGMYWRGMEPPKMSSTNSKSDPRGSGSMVILQSANWPWPPDCFLCRPCASADLVIVSRYGTLGGWRMTSTLYFFFSLCTTISTWSCRSEEHTSELQSRRDLVCRLLLEKKKKKKYNY